MPGTLRSSAPFSRAHDGDQHSGVKNSSKATQQAFALAHPAEGSLTWGPGVSCGKHTCCLSQGRRGGGSAGLWRGGKRGEGREQGVPAVQVWTPHPLSGCVPCCGSDLPPSPGWPRFSGRFSAGSGASAPARAPVRVMPCSGPACVSWLCQRAVSAQGTADRPSTRPGRAGLRFLPSLHSGKGESPPNPSPPPLQVPPCFLLVS